MRSGKTVTNSVLLKQVTKQQRRPSIWWSETTDTRLQHGEDNNEGWGPGELESTDLNAWEFGPGSPDNPL